MLNSHAPLSFEQGVDYTIFPMLPDQQKYWAAIMVHIYDIMERHHTFRAHADLKEVPNTKHA